MRCLLACSFACVQIAGRLTAASADSGLEYSATVMPARATAGQKVILTVACQATHGSAQGVSLDHKSLTVELARSGDTGEPRYAFPNRKTIQDGDLQIREGESAPPLKLRAGERRERSFDLNVLFPLKLLGAGDFRVGFSLWDGQRWIRSNQVVLHLQADPRAALPPGAPSSFPRLCHHELTLD